MKPLKRVSDLPPRYKKLLRETERLAMKKKHSLHVKSAFIWSNTLQGDAFWRYVNDHITNNNLMIRKVCYKIKQDETRWKDNN